VGWDAAANKAAIFGDGTKAVSWISSEDVAEYAVACFDDPKAVNQAIPLGGPENLTPNQVVDVFQEVAGTKFKVKKIPAVVPSLMSVVLRPFNPIMASIMALGACTARGDVIDPAKQRQFPVKQTSTRDYARKTLGRA
jgi:uncharacterized protein YbjT (DUF2867 family)